MPRTTLIYAERPPAGEVRCAPAKSGCSPGAGLARTVAARKARALSGLMKRPRPTDDPARGAERLALTTPPQLFPNVHGRRPPPGHEKFRPAWLSWPGGGVDRGRLVFGAVSPS